jgi:prepilin-type N-terminal cleavage/methylation domain-containing protein
MSQASRWKRREPGFTLMEILIAVAILAILSAALSPLVIKYVNDARRARALSDSQNLGQAILAFNLDTGRWPVSNDSNPSDTGEVSRLVGQPAASLSQVPSGTGATGAANWDGGGSGGTAVAIEDLLIRNQVGATTPIYPVSQTAPAPPGWNGPYLKEVPLDPWGNPYVCNVRYLDGAGVTGVTTAEEDNHAVFCLSAGPDGVFNTSFDDGTELQAPGGDDIGWPIQSDQTP